MLYLIFIPSIINILLGFFLIKFELINSTEEQKNKLTLIGWASLISGFIMVLVVWKNIHHFL